MFIDDKPTRARRRRWLAGIAVIAQAAAALAAPDARAAEIRWRSDKFSYVAQDKPLKEFIREFAGSQGIPVVIADEVEGTVNGKFDLTPQSLLEWMTTSFGLTWYYDGSVLYVSPAGAMSSAVIRLGTATAGELRSMLDRLGIADRRYPIAYDNKQNTAFVSGPTRYVELVKQTARALDQNETTRSATDIRVFPLRYAWAADFTYTEGGRERRLPGVVSVLRELYAPSARNPPAVPSLPDRQERVESLRKLRELGVIRPPTEEELAYVEPPEAGVDEATGGAAGDETALSGPDLPQFQADSRMNAVVVRDRPERMAFYEAVIRSLDVKPGLVEIEARILEVSSDSIDSLGIDWRLHTGDIDLQIGRGNLPNLGFDTALAEDSPFATPLPPGAGGRGFGRIPDAGIVPPIASPDLQRGGVLTTVLGDSGRYLIARINALAQDGKANILASPRVLTLDNVEAVLENVSTFFVRVAGNLDVALFDLSAGTSLRVKPLIVTEEGKRQVMLAIRIEDGSLTGQSVDQIPVVERSTIGTQAFITEGESLLVGGYESSAQLDTEVGVPGLSSVPVLGRLFKYTEKQTTQVQRLFLLTPRIVEP